MAPKETTHIYLYISVPLCFQTIHAANQSPPPSHWVNNPIQICRRPPLQHLTEIRWMALIHKLSSRQHRDVPLGDWRGHGPKVQPWRATQEGRSQLRQAQGSGPQALPSSLHTRRACRRLHFGYWHVPVESEGTEELDCFSLWVLVYTDSGRAYRAALVERLWWHLYRGGWCIPTGPWSEICHSVGNHTIRSL